MRGWKQISLLTFCLLVLMATTPAKPAWQMKADYVEACSCHLFCPCYFKKHAEHPHCEFNMAAKERAGEPGDNNPGGGEEWVTGEVGDEWGAKKKGGVGGVCFGPSRNKE